MSELVATIIIEPRSLVREALVSLMASHSYHVVCGVASTADIDNSLLVTDAPKLVILGALPAAAVAAAASNVRGLWPETKIVLLFEHASPADLQKLLASEIDACIPLFASPDTLIEALQQIIFGDLRILVLGIATRSSMPHTTGWQEEDDELNLGTTSLPPSLSTSKEMVRGGDIDGASPIRAFHSLSDREEQILKGLVKGHSNKMIARTCAVTEATVKVHMKSILRKIRVANRTQAAIWALENGYCADDLKNHAAAGTAGRCATKHGELKLILQPS